MRGSRASTPEMWGNKPATLENTPETWVNKPATLENTPEM
jgi:hypothetical protein